MKFDAVIFDLYGTLVNDFASSSVGQLHAEFIKTLAVPPEPFTKLWRETTEMRVSGVFRSVEASIQYVCDRLAIRLSAEQMARAVDIRLQFITRTLTPRPDALETLEELKDKGYKVGLLSNCSIEIPIVWQGTAFADLIESAVFSSRERIKKPDPRIYRLACERLCVTPENCLYVADGENHELAAAAKVGLHPVLLRNPGRSNDSELLREAREWQGSVVDELPEVLTLATLGKLT